MSSKDPVIASGANLIAETLKRQEVKVVFGIVGIPVVEVAEACIAAGIEFIGFRNEQSAAYAASVYGYLSGRPGVCLTVGGPGVVHALAGLLNSQLNCWPLVLLAGSCEVDQVDKGAFQELDQVEACRAYCKYSARPSSLEQLPFVIEKAFRSALYGRPGAAYVDLPADFIQYPIRNSIVYEQVKNSQSKIQDPPKSAADPVALKAAIDLLSQAKHPLVVIGKGAAFARAEKELLEFVEKTQIPFLPTPMGKGVISDRHPLCVSAARSQALKKADVVLLVGARLNWILHFGQSPRWQPQAKFIQLDIHPEDMGQNRPSLALLGDIPTVIRQLDLPVFPPSPLLTQVNQNIQKFQTASQGGTDTAILNYHTAFKTIKDRLPSTGLVYVSEGANTMDIGRSYFDVTEPRQRLDAGTGATMGVGMGYAIAAQLYYPERRVVSIVGDSAFGFSAMELETAVRARLPLLIFVINNSGIYHGLESQDYRESREIGKLPSTALSPEVRYDMIAEACGGRGWLVKNRVELAKAVEEALEAKDKTCLINVLIAPGGRTKLKFGWMQKLEKARL